MSNLKYQMRLYSPGIVEYVGGPENYNNEFCRVINDDCISWTDDYLNADVGEKVSGEYPGTKMLLEAVNENDPTDKCYAILANGGVEAEISRKEFESMYLEEFGTDFKEQVSLKDRLNSKLQLNADNVNNSKESDVEEQHE